MLTPNPVSAGPARRMAAPPRYCGPVQGGQGGPLLRDRVLQPLSLDVMTIFLQTTTLLDHLSQGGPLLRDWEPGVACGGGQDLPGGSGHAVQPQRHTPARERVLGEMEKI